jgi:hypothetical protein
MARFGRNLLGNLANPAFAGGLFTAGQQLASAPRRSSPKRRSKANSTASKGLAWFRANGGFWPTNP